MFEKSPLKKAGPSDRAGFIDAPVNGPPTKEQIATTEPIAIPAIDLVALESVAAPIIVSIKKKLINISKLEPPTKLNLLIVIPNPCEFPKKKQCAKEASTAPSI